MAAKKHLTLRIDEEVVRNLDAWAEAHGTSRTAAIERLVMDGIAASEKTPGEATETAQEAPEDPERVETHSEDLRAVCDLLRASNSDLRQEVSRLWAQLATKDAQLETAQKTLDQEQRLHAITAARSLPGEAEGKTLRQRIADFFRRSE